MCGIGRNEPCPCGSGLKYKRCCLDKDPLDGASGESRAIAQSIHDHGGVFVDDDGSVYRLTAKARRSLARPPAR